MRKTITRIISMIMLIATLTSTLAFLSFTTSAASSEYYPKPPSSKSGSYSLVELLNSINVASSFNHRSKIAVANNIVSNVSDYKGTANQNSTMVCLLKEGRLRRSDYTSNGNSSSSTPTVTVSSGSSNKKTVYAEATNVPVNTTGMYRATKNTAIRTSTGWNYSVYATILKGSNIQVNGTSGKYFKVSIDNRTYYVNQSDFSKCPDTTYCSLYYTNKSAVIRQTPYESGKVVREVSAGEMLKITATLTNSYLNRWYIVEYSSNKYGYIYSNNVKSASKLTVSISANECVPVGESVKLEAKINHPVNIQYSTSDSAIATVNIAGKLNTNKAGVVAVSAKVGHMLLNMDVTVFEYAVFPATSIDITQVAFESFSHSKQNAIDYRSKDRIVAPFTGKITYIDKNWGYVVFQSLNKVKFANGILDYMTVSFMHDSSVSDLWVGKTISKGVPFYDQGGMGNGNKNAYGAHVHMAVYRGKASGKPYGAGNVYVYDALFIDPEITKKISNPGKCDGRVYNGAPTDYSNRWVYLPKK